MNWAAEHELPPAQKASHKTVGYEHPASDPAYHCGNCRNLVRQAGKALRCRTVVAPIETEDWCLRFRSKEKS